MTNHPNRSKRDAMTFTYAGNVAQIFVQAGLPKGEYEVSSGPVHNNRPAAKSFVTHDPHVMIAWMARKQILTTPEERAKLKRLMEVARSGDVIDLYDVQPNS